MKKSSHNNVEEVNEELHTCLKWLKRRGFDARFAKNREVARKMIVDMVLPDQIVGCGDSSTIRSIGVLQDLADMGNRVLNPFVEPKITRVKPGRFPLKLMVQTSHGCDVFLSSSNAVTLDGKIVNIDGGGSRVSGIIFGASLRIIVVGRNKVVKDADEALYRTKNVIAPAHGKTIGPDWGFPCVAAGKCVEPEIFCKAGPVRMCNVIVILEGRPRAANTKMAVILVDEDLGLGWDPAWPKERIDKIYAEYQKFTPPHRPVRKK